MDFDQDSKEIGCDENSNGIGSSDVEIQALMDTNSEQAIEKQENADQSEIEIRPSFTGSSSCSKDQKPLQRACASYLALLSPDSTCHDSIRLESPTKVIFSLCSQANKQIVFQKIREEIEPQRRKGCGESQIAKMKEKEKSFYRHFRGEMS